MTKTVAYIRASTDAQDVKNQRHEILEYGNREGMSVDEFIEVTLSSRHSSRKRRIEELQERLEPDFFLWKPGSKLSNHKVVLRYLGFY